MSVLIKQIKLSSTSTKELRNLQHYILKPEGGRETSEDQWYFNALSSVSARAEMLALNDANKRGRRTYKHLLISYSPEVFPTRAQAKQASVVLLSEMGLDHCLSMIGMHYDKDHIHLHIAVVTINPDTFLSVHVEWSVEAMHRAVAIINFIQGWEAQKNQLYSIVKHNKQYVLLRNRKKGRALPGSEVTTFHGQQSAANIVVESIRRMLSGNSIESWGDFHRYLSVDGISYMKKGKGWVYVVNQGAKETGVKASSINHTIEIDSLFKKLGVFQPSKHIPNQRDAQPLDTMSHQVKLAWNRFQKVKSENNKLKKSIAIDQMDFERNQLAKQAAERKELALKGWLTRVGEFNAEKKSLAIKHRLEKSQIKQLQLKRKYQTYQDFQKKYGPISRFDDFLKFYDIRLYTAYKEEMAKSLLEKRTNISVQQIEMNYAFRMPFHVQTYSAQIDHSYQGRQLKYQYVNQDGNLDFTNDDCEIKVINIHKESISALVDLSSQKWKRFQLVGPLDFKMMFAKEALQFGVLSKIINPEVHEAIADMRKFELNSLKQASLNHWNAPRDISFELCELTEIKAARYTNPKSQQEFLVNSYLDQSKILISKPKNDYFRDLEIAIKLKKQGYSDENIKDAVNLVSPAVISHQVQSRYSDHLVAVIAKPEVQKSWSLLIERNQESWISAQEVTLGTSGFK